MEATPTRPILIAVIGVSGAAALVDQVAWVRLLTSVLGTSAPAVSVVVAVFMGGLAAGAALGGIAADRLPSRALLLLAIAEAGIAAGALAVVAVVPAVGMWVLELFPGEAGRSTGHLLRVAFAAIVLLPPTVLMGATLTLALRAYAPGEDRAGAAAGWLYAANTAGAAIGAAAAGLVLLERFGVPGTVALAAAGNAANALVLLVPARWGGTPGLPAPPVHRTAGARPGPVVPSSANGWLLACLAALVAGYVGLGLEVVWSRALVYRIGNSTYAFTAVLVAVLVGIAAGSSVGARLATRRRLHGDVLGLTLVAAGLAVAGGIALIAGIEGVTSFERALASWWGPWPARLLAHIAVAWAVGLPAAGGLGAAIHLAVDHPDRLGVRSGLVLAVNTVGSVGGALTATYLLVPALGTVGALRLLASIPVVVGGALALPWRRLGALAAAAALAGIWAVPSPLLRGDQKHPDARILFEREDPEAHVRLYRNPDGTRHVGVNGWSIGSDAPAFERKQALVGLLPFALRDQLRRVLVVGLGSGRTLSAIRSQSQVESIDVVEIVPSVAEAARRFSRDGDDPLADPRVRVYVEDGIHHLAVTDERYDVVSSDGKLNPQFAGNAYLYSREYYERARQALSARGVLVQWIPVHLPADALRTVLRTFTSVFEGRRSALFFFPPETLLLVGSPAPLDLEAAEVDARLARPGLGAPFRRFGYAGGAEITSARLAGGATLAARAGPGPRNSWLHPRLEFTVPAALAAKPTEALEAETLDFLARLGRGESPRVADPAGASRTVRLRAASLAVLEGLAEARRTGSYAAGAPAFERGRRLAPEDPRVRWSLAALATERQRLEDRIRQRPEDAEAHRALGRFLQRVGRADAARSAFRRSLELDPTAWRTWSHLGDLRSASGDAGGAVAAYRRALVHAPPDASLLANLATAHFRAGRLTEAHRRLEQALDLEPDSPELLNHLGIVQATRGALPEAEGLFRRALRHDPEHVGARNNLAGVLLQTGRGAEAVRLYEAVRDRDEENVAVLVNLARAYASERRWKEADRVLSKVLDLAPHLEEARRLHQSLRRNRDRGND